MKFECDSCHAQYMIADEKVGKRGVKVKCKRCSHVIIVRPDGAPAAKAEAPAARVEQAERSKITPTDAPPNLESTSPGAQPAPVASKKSPPAATPEVTGPARPAPVSMLATDTQLGGSSPNEVDQTETGRVETEAAPPVQMSQESAEEKTVVQPAAVEPPPAPAPAARAAPAAPVAATAPKGESNIGDALDDQLAGAFNHMFDDNARPGLDSLASSANLGDPSDEGGGDSRGPTRVLDLEAMNALRKATAAPSSSVVDRDALDSLRKDLSPQNDESSGLWDDKKALKGKAAAKPKQEEASGADDGPAEAVWHAAIDDEDVGPLTLAELGRHIEAGRVDRDSLVWKSGMDNWLPAAEVHDVKALFDRVPMPKIAADDTGMRKNGKGRASSFDVGAPIDDMAGGGSPFDNAPPAMEESDPAWRPHGLTDVYQAANLAEAAGGAGGAMGLIGGSAGMSARSGGPSVPPAPAEPEWRPSASSALASLVNDELDRINKGPLPADDDDLNAPRPADDASISGGLPFSNLMGVDLDAGNEISDPGAQRSRGNNGGNSQHNSSGNGFDNVQPFGGGQPSFAPQPAQPSRPPWVYPAFAAIAVVMLGMASLVTYKVVFATPQQQQVVMVGADGRPIQPGLPTVPPVVPVAVQPLVPVPVTPVAAVVPVVGAVAPVVPGEPATPAAVAPVEPPADPPADTRIAVASTPKKPIKPVVRDRDPPPVRDDPPPAVKEPKATPKGCDPVLDFDCKPGGKPVEAAKASKETLEKSDILPVVRDSLGKVKACGAKNKATGAIKMSWKINKSGKPEDVAVADPKFGGTPVGACVTGVVKAMKFPSYSGKAPPPVSIPLPLQ